MGQSKHTQARFDWRLAAIVLVAAALRIGWFLLGPQVMENEGGSYLRTAENISSGRGFVDVQGGAETMYTLLLPVLVVAMKLVIADTDVAARVLMIIAGTTLVTSVYAIARELYGRNVAVIAGVLVAVAPLLIGFSVAVYTETLFMSFVMAGSYFALRSLELTGIGHAAAAGLFWGLAYLARPEGIAYVLLTLAALWVAAWAKRKPLRFALRGSAAMTAVALLVAAPYVYYLWHATGYVRLEGKNLINYTIIRRMESGMSYNEAGWGIDQNLNKTGPLLDPTRYVGHSPYPFRPTDVLRAISAHLTQNTAQLLQRDLPSFPLGGAILWSGVIVGWFRRPWDRARAAKEMFLIATAGYVVTLLLLAHIIQFRYVVPLLPFLIVWCANGFAEIADWARATAAIVFARATGQPPRWTQAAGWGAVGIAIVGFVALGMSGVRYVAEINEGFAQNLVIKQAGLWLKQQAPGPKKIMDVSSHVPYYAQGDLMGFPEAPPDVALRYIDKVHPDFLVLWAEYRDHRQYLRDWIEHGIPSPKAEPIYRAGTNEQELIIYRWRRDAQSAPIGTRNQTNRAAARIPRSGAATDPHDRESPAH